MNVIHQGVLIPYGVTVSAGPLVEFLKSTCEGSVTDVRVTSGGAGVSVEVVLEPGFMQRLNGVQFHQVDEGIRSIIKGWFQIQLYTP